MADTKKKRLEQRGYLPMAADGKRERERDLSPAIFSSSLQILKMAGTSRD